MPQSPCTRNLCKVHESLFNDNGRSGISCTRNPVSISKVTLLLRKVAVIALSAFALITAVEAHHAAQAREKIAEFDTLLNLTRKETQLPATTEGWRQFAADQRNAQFSEKCGLASMPLTAFVQSLDPGLAQLEKARRLAESPNVSPVLKIAVRGLPAVFTESNAPRRRCVALDPKVGDALEIARPSGDFVAIDRDVWRLDTSDGTAASALLNPSTLPKPPAQLIAFVATADSLVLAVRKSMKAIETAAFESAEAASGTDSAFVAATPLAFENDEWRTWPLTASVERSAGMKIFRDAVHERVSRQLQREAMELQRARHGALNSLPHFVAGIRSVDLSATQPTLVTANQVVTIESRGGSVIELSWEEFASIVGVRLQPLIVDSAPVAGAYLMPAGLSDSEFTALGQLTR